METRPGCRVHAIIVTSCHGNDDEAWSTSCLIMQHKPYIVEQPPTKATITTQKYASWCRSAKLQMTGIGSIYFEIRLKFCPKCDIGICTTLVWGGPSVVSDGPSLIESCDFCVSMKLSSIL